MSVSISGSQITFNDASVQNTAATGFGFKNRIINGAMGIWQRGTSGFTSSGNYSADRWMVRTAGTLTTVAQSTDVPAGFKYSLNTAGSNYPDNLQRIESANCSDLSGQTVTISFWLKQTVGAGTNSMVVVLAYANSADSFGSLTTIGSSNITATSSWTQYTATFTSLPANAVNGLQIQLYANTASSATWFVTGVQLEKGSTATSFDYRPYGTELQLCQRYCFVDNQPVGSAFAAGGNYNAATGFCTYRLPVPMRSAPSFGYSALADFYKEGGARQDVPTSITTSSTSVIGCKLNIVTATSTASAGINLVSNSATATLTWSAEL